MKNKQKNATAESTFDLAVKYEKKNTRFLIFMSVLCFGSFLLTVAVVNGLFMDSQKIVMASNLHK